MAAFTSFILSSFFCSSCVCLFSSYCLGCQCFDLYLINQQSLFDETENIAWVDFNRGDNEVCTSSDRLRDQINANVNIEEN